MGLLYCLLTVTLRANQNVTGLAHDHLRRRHRQLLRRLADQADRQRGSLHSAVRHQRLLQDKSLPVRRKARAGSDRYSCPMASWLMLAIIIALHHRPISSSTPAQDCSCAPWARVAATADAAGINVTRYKYWLDLHRQHDRGSRRSVLRHGLRQRRLVQQRLRRPRLAGHRAGHLHHLASQRQRAGLHPVRRILHPVSLHPHRHRTWPSRSSTRCSPMWSRWWY